MKKRAPINNLYNEEDDLDLDKKIMASSLRQLVSWDFSFEKLSIDKAYDFVNSSSNDYSSSSLFLFSKESQEFDNPLYTNIKSKKSYAFRKIILQKIMKIFLKKLKIKKKEKMRAKN